MMQSKLQGQTLEDALTLAKENGIKKPQTIIKEVAASIRRFREFAKECGVGQRWIGPIETCLMGHLADWGLATSEPHDVVFIIEDTRYEHVRVEQAYKGNFHLLCSVDGHERKFVISKNKAEYAMIEQTGVNNLTEEQLYLLVKTWRNR